MLGQERKFQEREVSCVNLVHIYSVYFTQLFSHPQVQNIVANTNFLNDSEMDKRKLLYAVFQVALCTEKRPRDLFYYIKLQHMQDPGICAFSRSVYLCNALTRARVHCWL